MAKRKQAASKTVQTFPHSSTISWFHIVVLSVVYWVVYYYVSNREHIDLNGDNFAYYLLGKMLAMGKGYTNYSSIHPTPHNHFPPAFPFIISILIGLFDAEMKDIVVWISMFFYVAILVFYFTLCRIQSSAAIAFVVSLFLAINPLMLASANTCMSEIPFVLFSILGIYFLVKSSSEKAFRSWKLLLSVVFFAIGYYTKTLGVSLFAAMFCYFLFSKKGKHLFVSTISYIVLVLPWYIRGKSVGSSYMNQLVLTNPYRPELGNLTFNTFFQRVQSNFVRYISLDIPNAIFSMKPTTRETPILFWIVGFGIIAFVLLGIYRLKEYKVFFLAYIMATFAILLAWPDSFGGLRFVEVLVPAFLFLMIYGLSQMLQLGFSKIGLSFSPYWLLLFVLFMMTGIKILKIELQQSIVPNYANYIGLAKWAKGNTPKDAVFSARKPEIFIYYSERMTINYVNSLNDKEVLEGFRENGVNYVVLEQLGFSSTTRYLYPAILKNAQKFPILVQMKNPDTFLLKFDDTK